MSKTHTLNTAIALVGGITKLGAYLGISTQAVSQWEDIPLLRALEIERLTGGRLTVEMIARDRAERSNGG